MGYESFALTEQTIIFKRLSSVAQEEKFFAKHTIVDLIKMHKLNVKFPKRSRENNFLTSLRNVPNSSHQQII